MFSTDGVHIALVALALLTATGSVVVGNWQDGVNSTLLAVLSALRYIDSREINRLREEVKKHGEAFARWMH